VFLEQLAHRQAGQASDDYTSIRSYARTFSGISAKLVRSGVFTEYGQIRLFLSGLQLELVKHLVIEFGLDMHRPAPFQGIFVDIREEVLQYAHGGLSPKELLGATSTSQAFEPEHVPDHGAPRSERQDLMAVVDTCLTRFESLLQR
jgi:hypothetical protein